MSFGQGLSVSARRQLALAGAISIAVIAIPLVFRSLLSSTFLPHAFCYSWDHRLITLHLVSDVLIWLSYVAIASTLVYLVWRARTDMPFHWMFLAFGVFIVACGFTHFMEVVTLWKPLYWLSGYMKAITAAASVMTALVLPTLVPKIIALTKAAVRTEQVQADLLASNRELEAFSYSVSHDLRAPLRAIDGFSQAVMEDWGDKIGKQGKADLLRVRAATQRMGLLIDDLLTLARTSRSEMSHERVDLSSEAQEIVDQLQAGSPERAAKFTIAPGLVVEGDRGLLRVALENLLGNAWKFTSGKAQAVVELGAEQKNQETIYFVRDNGVGFDMKYIDKLFGPFQRLHNESDFPGTGVGLATVQRIVRRHGGRIWANAAVDQGSTFYFVL
jgi:signal transduction histidine kinase